MSGRVINTHIHETVYIHHAPHTVLVQEPQHIHMACNLRSSFSSTYTVFRGVYMVNLYMHNAMYTGVHVAMKVAYN